MIEKGYETKEMQSVQVHKFGVATDTQGGRAWYSHLDHNSYGFGQFNEMSLLHLAAASL